MSEVWLFDQPPKCAVITSRRIVSGESPILYVSHDADDHGWQFLDGGSVDIDQALLVSLRSIIERDRSLRELADLPPGCIAERKSPNEPWLRRPRVSAIDATDN